MRNKGCENLLLRTSEELVNIGMGRDLSISELAGLVKDVVEFEGEIRFDTDKPDGTPRKLLDVSRLKKAGWEARIGLRQGLAEVYQWFVAQWGKGDMRL